MVLRMSGGSGGQYGTGNQECATALVDWLIGLNGTRLFVAERLELYCTLLAGTDAVKAVNATAVVYLMILGVYAPGFTAASAFATVNALALVNLHTEH
jgi:hypothetical protein